MHDLSFILRTNTAELIATSRWNSLQAQRQCIWETVDVESKQVQMTVWRKMKCEPNNAYFI